MESRPKQDNVQRKNNNKKTKIKNFPHRAKTGAIEQKEISNLQSRYKSVDTSSIVSFKDMPLSKKTLQGLQKHNFQTPTEIQRESISLALNEHDVLGAAKTGSGKTLAFLIPVLERLYCCQWTNMDGLGALIITPTRELAFQIFDTFKKVGELHDFSIGLIIGGKDLNFEKKRLHRCNIMICTPGRLLHHMDENPVFDCSTMKILVIDEADRCLDLGFQQAMNGIIENLPPKRQTLLFSATQTKSVRDLARLSLKNPVYVSVHEHAEFATPANLHQSYIVTPIQNKIDTLWSFLKNHKRKKIIVFLTTCKQVRFLYLAFTRLRPNFSILPFYGNMHQLKRMEVYEEFCAKKHAVLFATDVAARGLDFPGIDWVVQYDCPDDVNSYIHRAGRTARFENGGESLLMLLPSEVAIVEQLTQKKIPIDSIEVNVNKLQPIQRKLEALMAKDVEMKQIAQRAFVTYCKSVHLMKDKTVFDIHQLDFNAMARSMGLAFPPRIRFYDKLKAAKNAAAAAKPVVAEKKEAEWRDKRLEEPYQFHADKADESNSEEEDSDEDILKIKRRDHGLEGADNEEILPQKKKKNRILTKERAAKSMLKKNIKPNKVTVFNDDGELILDPKREKVTEEGRAAEMEDSAVGGIDIEQQKKVMKAEDVVDKEQQRQRIKEKHRRERLDAKQERRKAHLREDDNEDQDDEEGGDDGWESYSDTSVQDLIDQLPDPDRVYGNNNGEDDDNGDDDEEMDFTPGPAPPKKIVASESDDEEDDESVSEEEESTSPVKRKRSQPSSDDDSSDDAPDPKKRSQVEEKETKKAKWVKPKGPKKAQPVKKQFDTGLDLALDEELALHLLGSNN